MSNSQHLTLSQIKRELAEEGIRSEKSMYETLPTASKRLQLFGIQLLENRPSASAIPLLAELLYDEDEDVRLAAASALAKVGGRASLQLLAGIVVFEKKASVRHAAVYSLSFMFDEEAIDTLMYVLGNMSEAPDARGLAAEGIANLFEDANQRTQRYKRAEKVLIERLDDRSPEVRFWAAFALGRLKSKCAIPHLRRLVENDKSVCRGWWSVAAEAKDALQAINGEDRADEG